jgi:hypothetical protein
MRQGSIEGEAMSIETAIYGWLSSSGTVSALVGTRISPEWRREGTDLPAVVYSVDGREPVRHMGGSAALESFEVSITCMGATANAARDLAATVRTRMEANLGWATAYDGTSVKNAYRTGEQLERIDDAEGTDDGIRAVRQTYTIWATGG